MFYRGETPRALICAHSDRGAFGVGQRTVTFWFIFVDDLIAFEHREKLN